MKQHVTRTGAPAFTELFTAAELREAVGLGHSEHDAIVMRAQRAAMRYVEDHTGQVIAQATYRVTLDGLPASGCDLEPLIAPVDSISAFLYDDADHVEQTFTDYSVSYFDTGRPSIRAHDAWPATSDRLGSVRIDCTLGYGTTAEVPAEISQSVALLVSHWYDTPQAVIVGTVSSEVEFGVHALLESLRFRNWG